MINLEETQWWPKNKLEELQDQLLHNILTHAFNNVPYYHKLFQERGLHPEEIKTKEDLKKLPILTKELIRKNYNELRYKPLFFRDFPSKTGGSTGEPLEYFWDADWSNLRLQSAYRYWRWAGYNKGDKMATLFSDRLLEEKDGIIHLGGTFEKNRWDEYLKQLQNFSPSFIYGYVWQVYLVASKLLQKSINFPTKSVIVTSETLYEFQRTIIKEAFQCPVFNEYGCNDGGLSAFECNQHKGLHHSMECSIIEIVDGKVIATDLWNRAQPFIRYENGDKVEKLDLECPCGRKSDLYQIKGRDNDIIITPKKEISPSTLMQLTITARKGFAAVQYVQQPRYNLMVNIVKNEFFTQDEFNTFCSELALICEGMKIHINFVEKIPLTPAGKTRFIINEDSELLKKYVLV